MLGPSPRREDPLPRFFSPQTLGALGGLMTLLMLAADVFGAPWTRVRLTQDLVVPVWVLFALFTLLQVALLRLERRGVELSEAEVTRWGPQLEAATPKILELVEGRRPVGEIASEVERAHQIPPHITERYIVALARFRRPTQEPP
jgi:hypothetical protein